MRSITSAVNSVPLLGVVGGMGPRAGIEFCNAITQLEKASTDQSHIEFVLLSMPRLIPDRTSFLLGRTQEDPVPALCEQVRRLHDIGASSIVFACITVHVPLIWDRVSEYSSQVGAKVLSLVDFSLSEVLKRCPPASSICIVCSDGTRLSGLYDVPLRRIGYDVSYEKKGHDIVYSIPWGLKASRIPSSEAIIAINRIVMDCFARGILNLFFACTELNLLLPHIDLPVGMQVIDSVDAGAKGVLDYFKNQPLCPKINQVELGHASYAE